ncbi:MAG: DegT/DnrJ/EryC1/StrS aminotransferase family protein [Spirochaetaceae bacterium]|jgi:dTDP-4-amino-4,6-dideoxygalactose transaminase|nr:DegT/DnrJ/EryC1/StrS aminotransferase family protein [Spirochaetaceae bacterium]
MQEVIPFAKPFIAREEEEAVLRVLRSGWITTGEETLAFEREFAAFLSREPLHALAVNSATAGLHLALEALGVGPGDVVLVPSYTFTASAEVAHYLGAELAFVDVQKDSFLMDPAKLEETIIRLQKGGNDYPHRGVKYSPRVIIPVHFAGLVCDMSAISDIAKKYSLSIVEDSAHAFPAWQDSKGTDVSLCRHGEEKYFAGTLGDIGVFSFYATKTITTGEGGMVVTRNAELAKRISIMRLHGIDRPIWNRYTGEKASWRYEVVAPGYKYNLCDILSAIGRVQLGRAYALRDERYKIASAYDEAFGTDERFLIPPTGPGDARQLYPLRLTSKAIPRDDFSRAMQEAGVGVSVHFIPLHTMPFYKKRYNHQYMDFPETMKSFSAEVSLPLWPGMSGAQIERVIRTARNVC